MFSSYCKDLESEKVEGDELTVVLLARYLRCNISILSPFNKWKMYPSLPDDIILMYDARYNPTQDLGKATQNQSKTQVLLDLFLNKYPTV